MKKILNLLVALPLLFVACNAPTDDPGYTPKLPDLELLSDKIMEIGAEGGEYRIIYNLTKGDEAIGGDNGITGDASPISSSKDVSWITLERDKSYYGELVFSVEPNLSGEERRGTITLSYRIYSAEVTVVQSAKDESVRVKGWAVVGSMTNNWDVASAIAMEEIDGYYVFTAERRSLQYAKKR